MSTIEWEKPEPSKSDLEFTKAWAELEDRIMRAGLMAQDELDYFDRKVMSSVGMPKDALVDKVESGQTIRPQET